MLPLSLCSCDHLDVRTRHPGPVGGLGVALECTERSCQNGATFFSGTKSDLGTLAHRPLGGREAERRPELVHLASRLSIKPPSASHAILGRLGSSHTTVPTGLRSLLAGGALPVSDIELKNAAPGIAAV
jgi:hypothetical protein